MGIEIEHKFLVVSEAWRADVTHAYDIRQAYLAIGPPASVRIRVQAGVGRLNIKRSTLETARAEFEYVIPADEAEEMMASLRIGAIVAKTRYEVPWAGRTWEIDVFEGENKGLVIAEIELDAPDEVFDTPPWTGADVSSDYRYFNSYLAREPFANWPAER